MPSYTSIILQHRAKTIIKYSEFLKIILQPRSESSIVISKIAADKSHSFDIISLAIEFWLPCIKISLPDPSKYPLMPSYSICIRLYYLLV